MKEIVKGLTAKRTPEGLLVLTTHYSSDPERADPAWKERERRKYTSESKWQSEQEIVFGAGGGERLFADILNQWGHKILIDPETSGFKPSPHWSYLGGFDVGKANPTAALVACTDYDGTLYILREYYQPGLAPKQHLPYLKQLQGFMGTTMFSDPSIFWETQAQADGSFKAISAMYAEDGITNLSPAPENNELLGMERILAHWMNLDQQEPTLKIICPKRSQEIAKPVYGVHNDGCPNLLWELRRTRRAELSPTQLMTKNPTEKIVDRDNHLRDCLKYLALTLPDPAEKTARQRAAEAIAPLAAGAHDESLSDDERRAMMTSALFRHSQIMGEAQRANQPARLGRRR